MTFDDLILKIGLDKILHFLTGSLITAFITLVIGLQEPIVSWGIIGASVIGLIVTAFFSFVKEALVDNEFNGKDIIVTLLGSIPIFIAEIFGLVLHELSN